MRVTGSTDASTRTPTQHGDSRAFRNGVVRLCLNFQSRYTSWFGRKGWQHSLRNEIPCVARCSILNMADPAEPPAVQAPRERKPKQATPAEHFKGRNITPDDNEAFLINYVRNATKKNIWYYRDRCGVARGPAPLPTLKEAWTHGLIDEYTLVWGQGLVDFLPIRNVRTLTAQIRTPEGALLQSTD